MSALHSSHRGYAHTGAGAAGYGSWTAHVLCRTGSGAVRVLRGLHWYLKEIMGENAYLHYLEAYRRRNGTDAGAMSAREFWKDLTDAQDRNPTARCC